jgi:hypothetical protein
MEFSFYRQAMDAQLQATPAYLEWQLRLFHDDRSTGLFQIHQPEGQQILLFCCRGELCFAYCLESGGSFPQDLPQALAGWHASEAPLRSLNLPAHALRAVLQAVEWSPAQADEQIEAQHFLEHLERCKAQGLSGLYEVVSPGLDGFVLLWKGEMIGAETIFCQSSGFYSGLPSTAYLHERPQEHWQVRFYPANPAAPTCGLLLLRLGFSTWLKGVLGRYQQMVGYNLLNSLGRDLVALARQRGWSVQVSGAVLIEQDLFPRIESAAQAYRSLLRLAASQIGRVIGSGLALRVLDETFAGLAEEERRALQEQALTTGNLGI